LHWRRRIQIRSNSKRGARLARLPAPKLLAWTGLAGDELAVLVGPAATGPGRSRRRATPGQPQTAHGTDVPFRGVPGAIYRRTIGLCGPVVDSGRRARLAGARQT